jgi:predicted 3-demethylubiquinone-9 3-methyltransferase (glyoxalase superfamily)
MQKIYPCLWFDNNAEEAVNLYTSIFKNSSIGSVVRSGKDEPGPEGSVLTIEFNIEGQHLLALNGGPIYKFTPAISLVVDVESQQELDDIWYKLSAVPEEEQCGWLIDKFGLSWQIVPTILGKLLSDKDKNKASRTMQAMLKMKKLDIAELQKAYNQG